VTIELVKPAATAASAVAIEILSREKEEQRIPKPGSTIEKEKALDQLKKIKDGVDKTFTLESIGDVVTTIVRDMASKNGAIIAAAGNAVIQIPKKFQTIYVDKEHSEENVIGFKSSESTLVVIPENKKPVVIKNVDLSQDIVAFDIPYTDTSNMYVSATQISSSVDSVTYNIQVAVKEVKSPTTIQVDPQNCTTGTSTRTIKANGTVSWNVIVLDKDGSVTITRSDTGASISIELPGAGKHWVFAGDAWWEMYPDAIEEMEGEGFHFYYVSHFPMLGEHGYGIYYSDPDPFDESPPEYFVTESRWSVPPQTLKLGVEYSLHATIERTQGTEKFRKKDVLLLAIDEYDSDHYSCMTSGQLETLLSPLLSVSSVNSDASLDSWSGSFMAPDPDEYNNKFQIEVYYRVGCTRYIYEWK
jgi:hypothetical protein